MKILTAEEVMKVDNYTIKHLPIASIDLMQRAAGACLHWFTQNVDKKHFVYVFCGPGNNGGDGLALAGLLYSTGYDVKVFLLNAAGKLSPDCKTNFDRLNSIDNQIIKEASSLPDDFTFIKDGIIVDALFGTGLSREPDKEISHLIGKINLSGLPIISIDLPSGIYSDKTSLSSGYNIVKASTTLTFQFMKTGLLVGENGAYFGKVEVLNIGLLEEATREMNIKSFLIDKEIINATYKPKKSFSHKGNYGHVLLIAGGYGKMGAAILAARGFLKSGAGLLTLLVPESSLNIIQTAVPEAMALGYDDQKISGFTLPEKINAIGIGPGLGTEMAAVSIMDSLLNISNVQMIIDADALNILAAKKEWLSRLPENSILTPHPGEFKRLAGPWSDDFDKLMVQKDFSKNYKVIVVLKGKNTSISCPDGSLYFNPTGNPGMAKGGSGDVLTGLITGLVASGYSAKEACILGVYLHGLAGDLAASELTPEAMNAGDLISFLPPAWKSISDNLL